MKKNKNRVSQSQFKPGTAPVQPPDADNRLDRREPNPPSPVRKPKRRM